ncbi:c-type cytochrome [Luminiphilus sp.]|jgi:cytochrome c5|nr:cytochrome c5 family protein [Luminiphilus sp.]MDA9920332.1 c-type cytochrome [bacterium]MDA8589820.1 c-type cytochrome [Luminiphilus sp.]MDA8814942.1 c-type cytochrome [Luminiphilus sp.]MDB2434072.1 c-type cytochrome [Luminiphilus sp.]
MKVNVIKFVLITAAALLATASVQAAEQPAQYAASCGACHAVGVAGAPKTGDPAQWEPRLAKGMEALVASVKNGLGVMPPGGLCAGCSDDDYKALITYMAAPQ